MSQHRHVYHCHKHNGANFVHPPHEYVFFNTALMHVLFTQFELICIELMAA